MSRGPEGVGFNSDRADVWDGSEWSFATWGDFTLSEPRHFMGSAVIEITLGEVIRLPKRCRVMLNISDPGAEARFDHRPEPEPESELEHEPEPESESEPKHEPYSETEILFGT